MIPIRPSREIKIILAITIFLSVLFLYYGNCSAQPIIRPGSGEFSFFVGPLFGDTSSEFDPFIGPFEVGLDDSVIFGGSGAVNLNSNIALEGILEFSPVDVIGKTGSVNVKIDTVGSFLHLNMVWHLVEMGRLIPYLTGGIGFMNLTGDVPGGQVRETDFAVNFGGGVKYFITDQVALRFEVRDINTKLQDTSDRLNLIQATAGISILVF
jgi:opacity protein-like surface antigen